MPIDSGNLALKGLDDLFSTEENRQEEQREQVQQIPIDALHPFTNHPFKVLDDEAMTRTVESIAQYGVLAPLIARPRPDGDGYEIISGHRRQYAAKLAGLETLPVIVRNMDDDAAVLLMCISSSTPCGFMKSRFCPTWTDQPTHGRAASTAAPMLEELTEELEGFLDITPEDVDEAVPRTRRTVNREKVTDHHAKLEQRGYEIKRGKYTSVKGTRQKRFIRFRTLGAGYSEDEIKAVIAGDAEHCPHQKQPPKEQPFHLLVDIQAKLSEGKSEGYARWAKKYNLKEMSKTLIFLQEKKIGSIKEMQERVDAATARYHELGDSIKAAETRMAEIAVLRTHIVNYAKTRPVYDAYRKAGYSKRFLENHRAEITLHKAAKAAFDESNLKTLPKVKELDAEYSKLLTEKKALYPDYRKAKDEMQELLRAQRNVELFFAEEKNTTEKTQSR